MLNMNMGQTTEILIGDWNMVTKKFIKVFITEFIRLPGWEECNDTYNSNYMQSYKIRPFH